MHLLTKFFTLFVNARLELFFLGGFKCVCMCACLLSGEQVYNAACQKLRNLLGALVAPKGGTIEQLAVKFSGGSAERSRVLLNAFEVRVE